MSPPRYRLGLILVTGSAITWSTAGFFTCLIPLDSWTMLAWRGVFGSLAIAIMILVIERRRTWPAFRHMGPPGWMFTIVDYTTRGNLVAVSATAARNELLQGAAVERGRDQINLLTTAIKRLH